MIIRVVGKLGPRVFQFQSVCQLLQYATNDDARARSSKVHSAQDFGGMSQHFSTCIKWRARHTKTLTRVHAHAYMLLGEHAHVPSTHAHFGGMSLYLRQVACLPYEDTRRNARVRLHAIRATRARAIYARAPPLKLQAGACQLALCQ